MAKRNVLLRLRILCLLYLLQIGLAASHITGSDTSYNIKNSSMIHGKEIDVAQRNVRSQEYQIVDDRQNDIQVYMPSQETNSNALLPNEKRAPRQTFLRNEETHIIYRSQAGRLALAGVMGASIGLFTGFLITVVACCCYLKFSKRGGSLILDRKNITYRCADLVDGTV